MATAFSAEQTTAVNDVSNKEVNEFLRNRGHDQSEPTPEESFLARIRDNSVSVFDEIDRKNYTSESAYIDALTFRAMQRADPAFKQARKAIAEELESRIAEQQKQEQGKRLEELKKETQLWEPEKAEAAKRAEQKTTAELSRGIIQPGEFAERLKLNTQIAENEMISTKAQQRLMNEILRSGRK